MAVRHQIAVIAEYHAGAGGGGAVGGGSGDGDHAVNDIGVNFLQRKPCFLRPVLHGGGSGHQVHPDPALGGYAHGGIRLRGLGGRLEHGNGVLGVGIFLGVQVILELLHTQGAEEAHQAEKQNHRRQQDGKQGCVVLGRPGGAGLVHAAVPGVLFFLGVLLVFCGFRVIPVGIIVRHRLLLSLNSPAAG